MSKNEKDGLEQYGAEHFGTLIFATIRKSMRLKGLTKYGINNRQARLCGPQYKLHYAAVELASQLHHAAVE